MMSVTTNQITKISWADFSEMNDSGTQQLKAAAKDGLFLLELPKKIHDSIPAGRSFANTFYKDEALKALKLEGFSGYNKREHDQIESFYASREIFSQVLPEKTQELAKEMDQLARLILDKTRDALGISQDLWTPGTSEGYRQVHFSVNHYRTEKEAPDGLKAHKDFGFVTLLDTPQKGLEVFHDKKWKALDPTDGSLIVFFDRALETFVNDTEKLQACVHKVVKQEEGDRISVSITLDGKADGPVYKLIEDGSKLAVHQKDYTAYLQECFATVYAPGEEQE